MQKQALQDDKSPKNSSKEVKAKESEKMPDEIALTQLEISDPV